MKGRYFTPEEVYIMNYSELKNLAKFFGLYVPKNVTKDELIDMILAELDYDIDTNVNTTRSSERVKRIKSRMEE